MLDPSLLVVIWVTIVYCLADFFHLFQIVAFDFAKLHNNSNSPPESPITMRHQM
jgi:hypothetical protein